MVTKRVGILYHPLNDAAFTLARELQGFLDAKGISVWLCSAWEGEEAKAQVNGTDLVLTVGGDGTILRAAQAVVPNPIPITGINLGKLGFMTELKASEAKTRLPALLDGEGWIDERAMLDTELISPTNQEAPCLFHALNDVVMARGAIARVVYVDASIDGEHLTTYKADGVIVATATGSTGYSLADGGPVLHPRSDEFILLPILPHLGLSHSLVLPSASVVKLVFNSSYQGTLSIDGHINIPLASGDAITIKHSAVKIKFLRIHPKSAYYSSLEHKLKGNR